MKCRKCNENIQDGFDWGKGEYTGADLGICEKCWTAMIDSITKVIKNSKGPLTALIVHRFTGDEVRKKQIENGEGPTEEEINAAFSRANTTGYFERVSKYTLEIPR